MLTEFIKKKIIAKFQTSKFLIIKNIFKHKELFSNFYS